MSTRDLQSIFLSGELTALNLGGNTADENVLTRAQIRDLLLPLGITTWAGAWLSNQTYRKDAIVLDGGYLMVANKETEQRPAPVPIGDLGYTYEVVPTFSDQSHVGVVQSGGIFTFTRSGWISRVLAYVPVVDPNVNYRILAADITDPGAPVYLTIQNPVVIEDGWAVVALGDRIVGPGTVFKIVLEAINSSATTDITGAWTYTGPSNAAPATSSWNENNTSTVVRISKTDLAVGDRTADLLSITAGSRLAFAMTSSPLTNYKEYIVSENPTDEGDFIQYVVTLAADVGTIPVGQSCDFTGAIPVAAATLYSEEIDYWLTNPQPDFVTVEGVLALDGVEQAGKGNSAFGIAFDFQSASVSEDWDFMAVSNLAGGSSGGDHVYRYSKVTGVTIAAEHPAYTPIDSLSVDLPPGTYELKFTFTWTLNSTTTSGYYRWRTNGGAWNEIQEEPSDITDSRIVSYFYPYEHGGGTLTVDAEGAKEAGADIMEILYHDLIFDEK